MFSNNPINISGLPRYEEVITTPIEKVYWKVIVIRFFLNVLFYGGIAIFISFLIDNPKNLHYYVIAGVLIISITVFLLLKSSFTRRSFALREHDIIYIHGILSRSSTIIPYNRIQHIVINEGLISRKYKLAEIKIFTAGDDRGDLKISGLLKADAYRIKELIIGRSKESD